MRIKRADLTLTDQIVEALRTSIATGKLSPHELHSVQSLVDELQRASGTTISRTPVREALVRLAEAGMVRFERNRGIRILRPGARDLEEIFQLRLMVEPPAAFRAARHINETSIRSLGREIDAMKDAAAAEDFDRFMDHDIAFHGLILQLDGNKRLLRLVRNLRDTTRTLGLEGLLAGVEDLGSAVDEHTPVLRALERHDSAAAGAAMYAHVERTGSLLLRHVGRKGEPRRQSADWHAGIGGHGHARPVSDLSPGLRMAESS